MRREEDNFFVLWRLRRNLKRLELGLVLWMYDLGSYTNLVVRDVLC